MAIFKRYKIFLVSAFAVSTLGLVFLLRYSSIAKINVKLSGSAELGLEYLSNLTDKLSQDSSRQNETQTQETTSFISSTQSSLTTNTLHDKVVNSEDNLDDLEACPAKPSSLLGPLAVDQDIPQMEQLNKQLSSSYGGWVSEGGAWAPTECKARTKMALIVPFRNRYEQLGIFVRHMHPMLKRQNVDYRIIIVEQSGTTPFNRAMLFNIGFKEALKFKDFDCFIFHDVDLIPEDDRNLYTCPTSPRHLSVAIDKFSYRLPYTTIFGGAGSFKRADFEAINGFSNKYWGWGGEDDDLYTRITSKGFKLTRPAVKLARYKMIKAFHKSSSADPDRFEKLRDTEQRMALDGLNNLSYNRLNVTEYKLYTKVTVDINPSMTKKR